MFIYLSKKIAIPNQVKLHSLAWNKDQGWITCGGDDGLLKVLKLEPQLGTDGKSKGLAAASNLSMNQTLEGHNGSVVVVTWNQHYKKLTTSDQYGLIIVWMLYKGMWYEEMINNRNKSIVKDMSWNSDGQKICIVYEDGAVIVGSVDGNRIWGKELKGLQLAFVQWSPDGKTILFGTHSGEVHIYDSSGNFVTKLQIYCLANTSIAKLAGIDWYDGSDGYVGPTAPSLAVLYESGRVQIMRHEMDEKPVLIDTGLRAITCQWNHRGAVLAIAGNQFTPMSSGEEREINMVQCYTPYGEHLRTLKVPGRSISSIAWEGDGLRIALAVDSFIYFANVRPDYKWSFFSNTLVYAYTSPGRTEHCVVFWDTKNNERYVKYVKSLLSITAYGDSCILTAQTDESGSNQYIVILCNAIGTPTESRYIDTEPCYTALTSTHVIVCSKTCVYTWHCRLGKLSKVQESTNAISRKATGKESVFHIDKAPSTHDKVEDVEAFRRSKVATKDPICCVAASNSILVIGRESGSLLVLAFPTITVMNRYQLRCRPQLLALNCDSTRASIIDISGILTFFDLDDTEGSENRGGQVQGFERKDVWDMKWASDNPDLFAVMEKTRMYIFRGTDPEEPIVSSAYICHFENLQIQAIALDEVLCKPDNPTKEHVITIETKSLRDSRDLLHKVDIHDAFQFIDENPHPRLWHLLAETALEQLEFSMAETAFVKSIDFQGIELVKRLRKLDNCMYQKAEIAAYFKRFEEAESIYLDIDRRDLAVELRMKLGDWFRVVHLLKSAGGGGNDIQLERAWNGIGDYYADRQKWSNAVNYYVQGRNQGRLAECYYYLEDYVGLEKMVNALPENHALLADIARKFVTVGLAEQAVVAFTKCGRVKDAIDCCVELNQWHQAVGLAKMHNIHETDELLAKYASHLLNKDRILDGIELYRKANHFNDAAKLLFKLAVDDYKKKIDLLRVKKLYVLAALLIEENHKHVKAQAASKISSSTSSKSSKKGKPTATIALEGLLEEDASVAAEPQVEKKAIDNAWRGAEALHFYLLSQRQLYSGAVEAAVNTLLYCTEYVDILDPVDVNSLLAIAALTNKSYNVCSKAFMSLESLESLSETQRRQYEDLALQIFVQHSPIDSKPTEWHTATAAAEKTETRITACIATGRVLMGFDNWMCPQCKHRAFEKEIRRLLTCPLCHSPIKK